MYDMTLSELLDTLMARRKGLGYQMWKQASLIGLAVFGKKYPTKPEKASPELYPKPKTIQMPEVLAKKERRR